MNRILQVIGRIELGVSVTGELVRRRNEFNIYVSGTPTR